MPQLPFRKFALCIAAACTAAVVVAPSQADARPRDRIAARRLSRLVPPGTVLLVPVPPGVVAPPVAAVAVVPPRRLAQRAAAAVPAAVVAAQDASRSSAVAPAAAQEPASQRGVARAGGGPVPPAPAAQTGAWTIDPEEPAADGTRSVLAPGGGAAAADPIELLPTPAPR